MRKKSTMDIAAEKRRKVLNQQNAEHTTGIIEILGMIIRYECCFCHQQFLTLSQCAKHIEEESITGFASPDDISVTAIDSTGK